MDSTQRFSTRVEDYIKYRPSYPAAALDALEARCGMKRGARVADVGSGTGIFTSLLLDRGCEVFAVEPNDAMRQAAERLLGDRAGLTSVGGAASATTLPDASVDLVTVAQAFHWFDREAACAEFARILAPGGFVALLWNKRHTTTSPFLAAYEDLLIRLGTDYCKVNHAQIEDSALEPLFVDGSFTRDTYPNAQHFDLSGFCGRALSSSYTPEPDDPSFEPFTRGLREIFDTHKDAQKGEVVFEYDTLVYCGRPHPVSGL